MCTVPKWKGERFCVNREIFIISMQAFQGECAAQTKLSEAQSELDRREWKMQNTDIVATKLAFSSNPRGWNFIKRIKLTDQTQRDKSCLCNELKMRNRAFQEDSARNCEEIQELRRICCTEAERA